MGRGEKTPGEEFQGRANRFRFIARRMQAEAESKGAETFSSFDYKSTFPGQYMMNPRKTNGDIKTFLESGHLEQVGPDEYRITQLGYKHLREFDHGFRYGSEAGSSRVGLRSSTNFRTRGR